MAGVAGFEPTLGDSKSPVLPLDDTPMVAELPLDAGGTSDPLS
jgi:hypothetical protein